MRIIVCGGRDYKDRAAVFNALDTMHAAREITELIEGGASGADHHAHEWAILNKVECRTLPADWGGKGKSAGPIRNSLMLTFSPDAVVAFPGGRGTADMTGKADRLGIAVYRPRG